jgi:circadian clock protein KaiC
VRGSAHEKDLRLFEITADGIVIGERLGQYRGLLTGSPQVVSPDPGQPQGRPASLRSEP